MTRRSLVNGNAAVCNGARLMQMRCGGICMLELIRTVFDLNNTVT